MRFAAVIANLNEKNHLKGLGQAVVQSLFGPSAYPRPETYRYWIVIRLVIPCVTL